MLLAKAGCVDRIGGVYIGSATAYRISPQILENVKIVRMVRLNETDDV